MIDSRTSDGGLERSCVPTPGDWIRFAPARPGLQRIGAFFSGHAYDPHRHDTYAIGYTLRGLQRFTYRGAATDSVAGNVIVLHPDELHDGRSGSRNGFEYRMLYIEPRLVRDALGERARSLPFVRSAVMSAPFLLAPLQQALQALDRDLEPLESDQAILALADALLTLDPSARGRPPAAACGGSVERARQFLDASFQRVVTSAELEAIAGLGRYELARHFRQLLGTSPYRYLTMRRLDHVRSSIRDGGTLADAAFSAGFADQSHMTRQFRQAYGLSPGRWRSLHGNEGKP